MNKEMMIKKEVFIVTNAVSQDFALHLNPPTKVVCYQKVAVSHSLAAPTLINLFINQAGNLVPVAGLLPLAAAFIVSTIGEFYARSEHPLVVRVVGGTLTATVTVAIFGYMIDC